MSTTGISKATDIEVIEEYLRTKDPQHFSTLYHRYAPKVFSKCLSLLKEEHLARDAVQDIFIKIFLNLGHFAAQSKFSTWVYSITYNYCIDLLRKKKRITNLFDHDLEYLPEINDDEVPDEELLTMEVSKLRVVLENIPVDDTAILLMKYQDEMMIKEIAEILGKTESAIKMKIKRVKYKALMVYKKLFTE